MFNIDEYESEEIAETEDPVLQRLKVKRLGRPPGTGGKYTLTDKALNQRLEASALSTGPTSTEGKAVCSQNGWKTGLHAKRRVLSFGKPCKSTCRHYPCTLVDDGATRPGQQCLDKEYLHLAISALSKAMQQGELTDLKELMTLKLADTLQIIDDLQRSIIEDGVYMKSEKLNKEGEVIGYDLKPNPSLLPLSNLLKASGVTLTDFMATPASILKAKTDTATGETIADLLSGLTRRVRNSEE